MLIPIRQMYKDMIGKEVNLCEFINHLLQAGYKDLADKIGNYFLKWEYETATTVDIYKHFLNKSYIFETYNNDFISKSRIVFKAIEFSIDEFLLFDFIVIIEDIQDI